MHDTTRDIFETAGYRELETTRDAALDRLAKVPAVILARLQAKARDLLTSSVEAIDSPHD